MKKAVQLQLFNPPTLNIAIPMKRALAEAESQSGLSRDEIVKRMNHIAGSYGACLGQGNSRELTKEAYEKWMNEQDLSRNMPLKALPIFCAAVGSAEPLAVLARPLGYELAGPEEQNLIRWAKAHLKSREARREMKRIEDNLEI